jgi:Na+/alanine symporter
MWVTAIVGIATKFFTCTLSVMYRDVDEDGTVRSGPMYIIKNALPKSMMPLAYFFAAAGLIGALPGFQSNQMVQMLETIPIFDFKYFNLIAGIVLGCNHGSYNFWWIGENSKGFSMACTFYEHLIFWLYHGCSNIKF